MATIRDYLTQDLNTIICKKDCEIYIDISDYSEKRNIEVKESENLIWLNGLICRIEFDDKMFNIILDYPVELIIHEMEHIKKESIRLTYKEGDTVLVKPAVMLELAEQALYVERLMAGKEVFKNVEHLLIKLIKTYQTISGMDLVHLEILLSNCLRDKTNPSYPARIGKTWDPVMLNIKKVIFSGGFLAGLAFENIGEAVKTGLVAETVLEPSILEKVLTGTLVEEKKKR
ncbi:hypothetical protein KAR91_37865 [Candidatus Pacearchaeota archaeon]|nr:hypothetical protein [Candidatus Pacearchaeota archaeon]